jgi:transketolase
MEKNKLKQLEQVAGQTRAKVVETIQASGSGHLAGSLGMVEVFTYLYHHVLSVRPQEPEWSERDLLFLSAGHLCPTLYVTLASKGYFDSDLLLTMRRLDSPLQGHPRRQVKLGIENSAGPLGQGISMAVGAAYQLQQEKSKRRVVVISSDGEQQEGQCWEAYLFAAHYQLKNLTILIDCNGIQQSGAVKSVMNLEDLKSKLLAFNLAVGVCEGNDLLALDTAWKELADVPYPKVLLCQTTAGKGVDFMENDYHWHAGMPSEAQWEEALRQVQLSKEQDVKDD